MKKVVIATLGSLGDVLPLLAVAKACRESKFEVVFAANKSFRETASTYDVRFAELGATKDDMVFPGREAEDAAMPFIEQALCKLDEHFDAMVGLAKDADAIVSPYWVLASHLTALKLDIPYVACALSPAYLLRDSRAGSANGTRMKAPPHWHALLAALRRRVGLRRIPLPYAEIFTAASAMLGLYPHFLSQELLPVFKHIVVCGYPHLQQHEAKDLDPAVLDFCDDRTVTFSFGSYVDAIGSQTIFEESVAACRALGLKCLYLSAFVPETDDRAGDVLVRPFIDHDIVFPRSAIAVHHAGMGTLMSACRSRIPMICVPSIYDQPYNACRMNELIGAPQIRLTNYTRHSLVDALVSVSNDRSPIGEKLRVLMDRESCGAPIAADVVGRLLSERAGRSIESAPHPYHS